MRKMITAVLGLLASSLLTSAFAAPSRRPNIVYLFADQWRASATGYAGDPNVKTPQLDRLARLGVRFENAVSVCPVCTPYRAALMTGRYPTSTGMFLNDVYLPDEALCMAEILRPAGYATGYIGKWHLDAHGRHAFVAPERRQGFEYWKAGECDHEYTNSHYYAGNSPQKRFWEGYDAFAQTRDAQQFIRDHAKGDQPFLLVVSYGVPHFPLDTAPPEYQALYPPESLKLPPNVPEAMSKAARRELSGYYAHCTALDKCVGEVIQTLEDTGIAENTLLVFTSDHGDMMGSQGVRPRTKQVQWAESSRVPFLLRYPALKNQEGRVIKTPISTPDILPTLLGLAEVAIPRAIEGEDLSGLIRKAGPERDRAALFMAVAPSIPAAQEYRGIRTIGYTYVRNLAGPWLLFDHQADPYQMKNLVNDPARAGLQREMDARLQAELKKIGDELRPRQYYLDHWGYQVSRGSDIPRITPDVTTLSPADARFKLHSPNVEVFKSHLPKP